MKRLFAAILMALLPLVSFCQSYTNVFTRDGATYVQRGRLTIRDYVVTNIVSISTNDVRNIVTEEMDAHPSITTNDVCGIVTNEVDVFTEWQADTRYISEIISVGQPNYTPGIGWKVLVVMTGDRTYTMNCTEQGDLGKNETILMVKMIQIDPDDYRDFTITRTILGTSNSLGLARLTDLAAYQTKDGMTNYYNRAQTDNAINAIAAYYITADAEGSAFATYTALTNATAYYSGGAPRNPTRNDYAVVLADETHGGNEWRYIFAVPSGETNGQWEAQYPIETNDYEGLGNKPQINGVELIGNKTAAALGLATPTEVATAISSADTTYKSFALAAPTNVNQSVQYLNITVEEPSILSVLLPEGNGTKDWLIYVQSVTNVAISLPAATWWMADVAFTNDIAPATPTALYFSQISAGLFLLSRQELAPITITAP